VWRPVSQRPHPADLVRRIFLDEMDPATVTSVCAGQLRALVAD